MLDIQVTARTGAETRDWAQMEKAARLILAQDPPLDQHLAATANICAAAKALGRPADAAAARHALQLALDRDGLTLKGAAARFNALPAAAAIAMACGDLETTQSLFRSTFIPREQEPIGQIVISDADSIAAACQRENLPFTVVDPECRIALSADARGYGPPEYTVRPFVSAVIPGGEIFAGWDFARTPSGTVLGLGPEDFYGATAPPFFHLYSDLARSVAHYWPRRAVDVDEDALFLPAPFKMHHGHWIVDGLPRLKALEGWPGLKVAIPIALPARQRELLRLFGVEQEQLIQCELGVRYRFRNLLVAEYDTSEHPSPGKVKFVADALRKPRGAEPRPRRVFVTRGVNTRRAVNHDEMNDILAAFGFVSVNLATMSIAEQRDCFSAADVVIATYGSDLLVAYFMQPGARFIELNWEAGHNGPIAPACAFLGIGYHLFLSKPVAAPDKVLKKDTNFVVDCAAFRGLLERVAAAPA